MRHPRYFLRYFLMLSLLFLTGCPGLRGRTIQASDPEIRVFNHAIEKNPSDARLYVGRGLGYFFKHCLDCAMEDYNRAIKIDPFYGDAYLLRALLHEVNGSKEAYRADIGHVDELGLREKRIDIREWFKGFLLYASSQAAP